MQNAAFSNNSLQSNNLLQSRSRNSEETKNLAKFNPSQVPPKGQKTKETNKKKVGKKENGTFDFLRIFPGMNKSIHRLHVFEGV